MQLHSYVDDSRKRALVKAPLQFRGDRISKGRAQGGKKAMEHIGDKES